ncbi:pescadillo homolog [Ricinus communis]|uniref:Pescadillo homolog n=1 Tax=Ricinus communis TaxID=3988 RepID=B9S643_RICCO|nr:pescadillo homolog [Ricinus communis]EEF40952.1 Pescadillo, putative [Ricinus communis]|eukprot:XP_002521462.1 pescadillo homolog [Ricinus communis]
MTKKIKHYRPPGKKKEGNAARFITRSQAVKQLQCSLSLFRRLCILKGIFPREPKKKVKGNNHTYYHVKDIAYLQHEPLLEKFREIRAYQKKIKKALAKKDNDQAIRLQSRQPAPTYDRIILQRYPKFVDALRDLDDCLTMVHLFAVLPAIERLKIDVECVHNCRRLSHEWQAYVVRTHKLRKVFVSVKGIYYQAEVEGQKITWLTPHALQQVLPDDVNYSVMLTFLELYQNLLGFINFRLYHSINVAYPPILDPQLEALAAGLYALSRYIDAHSSIFIEEPKASSSVASEQVGAQVEGTENEESEIRLAQLQHQLPSNEPGALMHLVLDAEAENEDDQDTKECKKLFKNMRFFLSREVPRESLLFVIPAFGGVVSWDGNGAPFNEADPSITHQIVDRPTQGHKYLSREYVQPQWIYDCVNARIILPSDGYLVGRVPPPHLSPFVDNEAEGYVPDYAETIKRLQAAAKNEVLPISGVGKEDLDDPQNLLVEGYISRTEAIEAAETKRKLEAYQKLHHEELKMELQGPSLSSASKKIKQSSVEDMEAREEYQDAGQQSAEDSVRMDQTVMSRKKRSLYMAMQKSNERKDARNKKLKERKKAIEGQTSEKH